MGGGMGGVVNNLPSKSSLRHSIALGHEWFKLQNTLTSAH